MDNWTLKRTPPPYDIVLYFSFHFCRGFVGADRYLTQRTEWVSRFVLSVIGCCFNFIHEMSFPRRIPHLSCSTRSATVDAPRLESPPSYWFRKWFVALEKKNELSLLKVSSRRTEYAHPVCCSNGFPGMSSNDRAILFLMIILEKTVSTVKRHSK